MNAARQTLANAITRRDAAAASLRDAQAAVASARGLVADLAVTVAGFSSIDERIAAERAASLKAAMKAGVAPTFETSAELADAVARKAEAENQHRAARSALDELTKEAGEAQTDFDRAFDEVSAAIEGVLQAEASELTAEIERREAELMRLRIRLQPIDMLHRPVSGGKVARVQPSPDIIAALRKSLEGPLGDPYSAERRQVGEGITRWRGWINELATDATATL